ncbi:MAG TPA: D-alanyl-D-alanine carboxypeptidase/D-alanyl-D-alanine-endopeptidase, partial [Candidatus Kapabacteria bacterium]|nr:D-alanyl-D-alanine carboxypeptidase/D-alanyl-D-alanine-endopeptidase [Candidatus Kapabacteria bacterium]
IQYPDSGTKYGVIENNAVTGPDTATNTIDAARELCSDTLVITGTIPLGHSEVRQQTSVEYPERYATQIFQNALREKGIKVLDRENVRKQFGKPEMRTLASGPPLSRIILAMNKTSDNFYAECLFRTVAKVVGGEGSWTRGIQIMRKYLASIGIDTLELQFTDGSGLSRMDLVTADAIVKLLRVMSLDPKLDSAFYNSLPIMGVDGTLENRLKNTPAMGNIHAKTGSMTGVRAVSGYLTTRDGEPIAFSILANNYTVSGSEIGKLEDEVLLKLVNFSRAR